MSTCLVTGSEGFIGRHLVQVLKQAKHRVIGFDIQISLGEDITHPNALDFMKYEKVDFVFHLAALKSVPFSFLEPYKVMETNAIGTRRVIEACEKYGVKKLIYSSSSSIYGGSHERGWSIESDTPRPLSPYAISKLSGEYFCQIAKLPTVILRYFNVFGPGQQTDSAYAAVIPKWIEALKKNEAVELYGNGHQARDFTYIDDVIQANILAMKTNETGIFNIARGQSHTLLELLSHLERIMKKKASVKLLPSKEGDIFKSCASKAKANSLLGYTPKVGFVEGLKRMVEKL